MSQTNELEEVLVESKTESLEIEQPVIKTVEQIRQEEKDLKYNNFLINFSSRVEQWKKSNGNVAIPLYWDSSLNDFIWLNRAQRRYK